ncbi:hypothetical protein DL96DRAFT_1561794 [Flagelloscypha sp. PMI_526]|nr:hypothetical protein DL96DRAFT_1561794 [Flagelloscypha sp. PMI_526]
MLSEAFIVEMRDEMWEQRKNNHKTRWNTMLMLISTETRVKKMKEKQACHGRLILGVVIHGNVDISKPQKDGNGFEISALRGGLPNFQINLTSIDSVVKVGLHRRRRAACNQDPALAEESAGWHTMQQERTPRFNRSEERRI